MSQETKSPEQEKAEEKKKDPTVIGLLWDLSNLVFKKEALVVLATVAILLAIGGGTVIYAQDTGIATIKKIVASEVKTEAEKREELERRFIEHAALTEKQQNRMEAKIDRMDGRIEQMVQVVFEMKGRRAPPQPELKGSPEDTAPWRKWGDQ